VNADNREDAMARPIKFGIATAGGAQFESPLALWIAIWQQQLVAGRE
jgi:hypothetical protein